MGFASTFGSTWKAQLAQPAVLAHRSQQLSASATVRGPSPSAYALLSSLVLVDVLHTGGVGGAGGGSGGGGAGVCGGGPSTNRMSPGPPAVPAVGLRARPCNDARSSASTAATPASSAEANRILLLLVSVTVGSPLSVTFEGHGTSAGAEASRGAHAAALPAAADSAAGHDSSSAAVLTNGHTITVAGWVRPATPPGSPAT